MRSASLATTIFHEKTNSSNESTSNNNHPSPVDKHSSVVSLNKLVFSTAPTTNSKAPYWTVTDRQPEWYKLSIPIHQSASNSKDNNVPYKRLVKIPERKRLNSNRSDRIDQPT